MANIGIATPEAVAAAADKLLAAGRNPSVALVRERLEGGSPNTINKHLNAWRQQLGQRFLALQQSDDVPVPLREGMLALWTLALDHARTQAADELAQTQTMLERDTAALATERQAMASREQSLRDENRQLSQSLEDAGERLTRRDAEHAAQVERLRQELDEARTAVQNHQSRVAALSSENGRMAAALEALETRLKDRQEAEDRQHAADLARIDEAVQAQKKLKSDLASAIRTRTTVEQARDTLQATCRDLETQLAVLAEKLKGMESHHAVLVDQLSASRSELARLASRPRAKKKATRKAAKK